MHQVNFGDAPSIRQYRTAFFLVASECLEKGPFRIRLNRPVLPPSSWQEPSDYMGEKLSD